MFYKYENEVLVHGPYVSFVDGTFLSIEHKDMFTFPIEDWYYFATEQEAKDFFEIEE